MMYLEWLKDQVVYFDTPFTYDRLLDKLYTREYIPILTRDKNRANDGIALRSEYLDDYPDDIVDASPCSFLEFLIALARRMNYIYADVHEDRTQDMFWTLIFNMGLYDHHDFSYDHLDGDIVTDEAVDRIIDRTYEENGYGGLFPLDNATTNQRNVEIWYQMNQYLSEVMKKEGRL